MAEETLENINATDSNINFDETKEAVDLEELQEAASFLKISELKLKCRAKNLRLKEDDVIVAVDGKPFHGSILEFTSILTEEEDKKTLLTLRRQDIFFEVMTFGSLNKLLGVSKLPYVPRFSLKTCFSPPFSSCSFLLNDVSNLSLDFISPFAILSAFLVSPCSL